MSIINNNLGIQQYTCFTAQTATGLPLANGLLYQNFHGSDHPVEPIGKLANLRILP